MVQCGENQFNTRQGTTETARSGLNTSRLTVLPIKEGTWPTTKRGSREDGSDLVQNYPDGSAVRLYQVGTAIGNLPATGRAAQPFGQCCLTNSVLPTRKAGLSLSTRVRPVTLDHGQRGANGTSIAINYGNSLDVSQLGVKLVPQPIPQQVHGKHRQQDGHPREEGNPPGVDYQGAPVGNHQPPGRVRGRNTGPQEA